MPRVVGYQDCLHSQPALASAPLRRRCNPTQASNISVTNSRSLAMHTLFGTNILSPPPAPTTQHNPFELIFHASASTDSTASASSCSAHSSPTEYSLLTRRLQDERQAIEDYRNVEPITVRRKGHPKLLLMGQRRWVGGHPAYTPLANVHTGVANLRSKMLSYRKCLRRRHSTLNPPTR